MDDIVNLLMNNGTAIVVLAYFIFRDYKFMQKLESTLDLISQMIKIERTAEHGKDELHD